MLLLLCLPLLFKIWQSSGSCCCCCYIVDLYCLRFDRGVVHIVVAVILLTITVWGLTEEWFLLLWLLYCSQLLFDVWQRNGSYCCCWLYSWPLLFEVWQRSGSYCCGCYIVDHYCLRFDRGVVHIDVAAYFVNHYFLMFDRGVVHIVVAVILLTITVLGVW